MASTAPSTSSPVTPASINSPPAIRPRWRRRIAALLALLVIVAGGGIGLRSVLHRGQSSPPLIPTTLALDLSRTPLQCPTGPIWSPDGTQFALWQTNGGCQDDATRALAVIFDTHTGKAVRTIDVARLFAAHGISANGFGITNFAWSPDGKEFAVAVNLPSTQQDAFAQGLLLIPLDGSKSTFYGPKQPASEFATLYWNVRAGTLMSGANVLPTALSYQWTADGHVIPAQAFPMVSSSTDVAAPTGRPVPANGFTFWQDGRITSLAFGDPGSPPSIEEFTAGSARWSPDGQYLLLDANILGILQFTSPVNPQICSMLGLPAPCQLTDVPPPDAAVSAVLNALARPVAPSPGPNGTVVQQYFGGNTPLAWSASGKLLATILPQDEFSPPTIEKATITVMSTDTGGTLATFPYVCTQANTGCSLDLSWSPNGKQLAAFDFQSGKVVLWNTAALTH